MPQPPPAHLRRVVGIAEIDPFQVGAIHAVGREEAQRHGVLRLLHDKIRKHRDDVLADAVGVLVHHVDQAGVLQLEVVIDRAHAGIGFVVRLGRRDGGRHAAPAIRADGQAAALAQPVDLEGGEEQMQQAGVIRIAHVLGVHLPVVGQHLGEAADDLDAAAVEDAGHLRRHIGADEGFDVGRVVVEGAEHQPEQRGDAQLARAIVGQAETLGHAALAVYAALESDRLQIAAQVVAPSVVDALKILRPAPGIVQADQRAAMRAAIFECRDRAVGVAHRHNRHLPDLRGAPVARLGDLGFQAQEVPHRPFEDALLLGLQQRRVAVHPRRHPRDIAGPGWTRRQCGLGGGGFGHRISSRC
jgi:hypothetical protein